MITVTFLSSSSSITFPGETQKSSFSPKIGQQQTKEMIPPKSIMVTQCVSWDCREEQDWERG